MRPRSRDLRYLGAVCALLLMLVVTTSYAAGRPTPQGRDAAEMPSHVQTEGMTYSDYRANQAAMLARLVGSVPATAMQPALRVEISQAEIDAVDRAPRISGTPLQIGLVKGLSPRFDLDGLRADSQSGESHRGSSGVATRSAGGFAWAMPVVSVRTGSLRLHIENMSLAPNAALYFYSRAGEAFGPYVSAGPNGDGDFWTDTVFGTEGILQVEITGPATAADLQRNVLAVTEVGIVTPRFAGQITPQAPSFCGDPACLVDATCYNSTPANPAKNAVAKMEWTQGAYIYTCTGGLISDSNPTQGNFFLTANHCVASNHTAKNLQFYWRFATSTCNGTCPSNSGWPYKTMGATVAATGKKGDFTLLQLNANPPSGSVFLGWTSAPIANTDGAQVWRISNPDFGPQVYSQHNVDTTFGACGGWPRGNWIYSRDITGAIDGGSSGSPIVNASSQIVGQLSGTCGASPSDPCASGPGEANATVDGAFAADYVTLQPIINP